MDPFRETLNLLDAVVEDEYSEIEELEDAIEELGEIQQAYAQLNERLADAIRAYVPGSYQYWRSYGLAQLAIVTQGEGSGFASHDKSIDDLIQDVEERIEDLRNGEMEEDVDQGRPVPTRKERF